MTSSSINTEGRGMTASQIRDRIDVLQREKDAIDAQVTEAKRLAAVGEGFSDPVWLTNAELAAKIRGRKIGRLQATLGDVLRQERARLHSAALDHPSPFERAFVRLARELIPRDLYDQIVNQANAATKHTGEG
jgi:hypothetical protein